MTRLLLAFALGALAALMAAPEPDDGLSALGAALIALDADGGAAPAPAPHPLKQEF